MDFTFGLFAGIAFWPALIILLWLIATTVCVVNEAPGIALILLVAVTAVLYFMNGFNPFLYVYEHPFRVIMYAVVYVGIGIAYSAFRWDWHVARWRDEYDAIPKDRTDDRRSAYRSLPTAARSKYRIITWMAYWPWSAFWWACADFLKEMFSRIYARLSFMYVRIAERRLTGIEIPPEDSGRQPRDARRLADVIGTPE
jgi:hypothetical protein